MIPTASKHKLPGHLSYPIGAQALTEGLAGAPHLDSLTVSFWDQPVWPASRFQKILADKQPYVIMAAAHDPVRKPGYGGSNSFVESGWYDEKWKLTVYPVLRELRHMANELLREKGLGLITQWLRCSTQAVWLLHYHRIELIFHPLEESITTTEENGV